VARLLDQRTPEGRTRWRDRDSIASRMAEALNDELESRFLIDEPAGTSGRAVGSSRFEKLRSMSEPELMSELEAYRYLNRTNVTASRSPRSP
jgi:hypothetical protein